MSSVVGRGLGVFGCREVRIVNCLLRNVEKKGCFLCYKICIFDLTRAQFGAFGVNFEPYTTPHFCANKANRMIKREFEKYAYANRRISSAAVHDYANLQSAYVSPTIIEERQLNVAQMDVFSRLMMDRIIFLGAPINDDVANIIQAQLLFLETADPERDIQIYINSPGGSVSAGLGIYDTMQLISPDVATICTGLAASMGAVLLTAGTAGKRSALPHARIMIHQPLGGVQGQASDIEITAREIMRTKQELYEILSHHSGVAIDKIAADADRDYWLRADEAKEYGLIDEVLTKRAPQQTIQNNSNNGQ